MGTTRVLEVFGTAICIAFLGELAIRLALAPRKGRLLRPNWLTVVALVPAFHLLRALRLTRAARGLTLVRIIGTATRAMNALRASLRGRGLGYAVVLTTLETCVEEARHADRQALESHAPHLTP